jgi:hypothetical protein
MDCKLRRVHFLSGVATAAQINVVTVPTSIGVTSRIGNPCQPRISSVLVYRQDHWLVREQC